MGIVEAFTNIIVHEEEKEEGNWLQRNSLLIMIILIKLVFIYIIMLLWPKVMPKLFPGVTKQPKYINLIGLSVILSLL
tara:strand:+ start:768 stop:1001 length:234 start_codon:yes stop_codon:yes gene_type:complete